MKVTRCLNPTNSIVPLKCQKIQTFFIDHISFSLNLSEQGVYCTRRWLIYVDSDYPLVRRTNIDFKSFYLFDFVKIFVNR